MATSLPSSPSTPSPRPLRERLTREERRNHLLDAAATLAIRDGVEAVTMEGVAAEAGVSKTLGYAYFDNRDDLLMQLFQREAAELATRAVEAVQGHMGFEQRVRAAIRSWFDMVDRRGTILGALLQHAGVNRALDDIRRTGGRDLEGMWAALGVQELGLERDRATAAAAMLLEAVLGAQSAWIDRGLRRDLVEETFVSLVMGGLGRLAADSEE